MPGRKKQFEKSKSFRLNPSDEEKIRKLAELYGVDESTVIRDAIGEKYERDIASQGKPPKRDSCKS